MFGFLGKLFIKNIKNNIIFEINIVQFICFSECLTAVIVLKFSPYNPPEFEDIVIPLEL